MTSGKERVANFRKRLKEDPIKYDAYLKSERLRWQKKKEAVEQDDSPESKELRRKETALKVKRWRLKKKLKESGVSDSYSVTNPLGSYKCLSSLTKAVRKIEKSLPQSPSKQQAALNRVVKAKFGTELFVIERPKTVNKGQFQPVSSDIKQQAVNFYLRDDISWQAPGKRDTISIKDDKSGKRVVLQKRFLLISIMEAKQIFDQENDSKSLLSPASFYALRPPNVLPFSKIPHNVCVCIIHANFLFIVKKLMPHLESVDSYKSLMKRVYCDEHNEKCMLTSSCDVCINFKIQSLSKPSTDRSKIIKYERWEKVDGREQVVEKFKSIADVMNIFNEILPEYKKHSFVKKVQFDEFERRKDCLKNDEIVCQIDFAENASLISQDEIQAAHWRHGQVTLFTCVIWTTHGTYSYVVVSDDFPTQRLQCGFFSK